LTLKGRDAAIFKEKFEERGELSGHLPVELSPKGNERTEVFGRSGERILSR